MHPIEKTNPMRMLEQEGISYDTASYPVDENDLSGLHAAKMLGTEPDRVFKTLVAKGEKRGYLVFCIPAAEELDLKKAARAAGDKRVELLPLKELLPVTGYMRGGCSPIGMKKHFPTYIEETAALFDSIYISAGKRGVQLIVSPEALMRFLPAQAEDLIQE